MCVMLIERGILKKETFDYFEDVGWNKDMKFLFHVPDLDSYESILNKYMTIYSVEYGDDVYSKNFPLHIVGKKNNTLFKKEH